jgi:hypothetical protein
VDRHHFHADSDQTFNFDADPDTIPSFTHVGKPLLFYFLVSVIGVIILNIFDSLLKCSAKKPYLGCFALLSVEMGTDPDRKALGTDPAK